jgi:hypothetical protein
MKCTVKYIVFDLYGNRHESNDVLDKKNMEVIEDLR